MQHLEVSGAVRHIYIYVIRQLKVKQRTLTTGIYLILNFHKLMLFQSDKLMVLCKLNALHQSKAAPVHNMKADGRGKIKLHSL